MFSLALLLHPGGTFSWSEWKLYPSFLIGWLLFFGAYLLVVGPLRHHFRDSAPVPPARIASFVLAMVLMLVGLQGPLHELSDLFLFSAHMVQHLLIMVVMPPFLIAGTPDWLLRPALRVRPVGALARLITRPLMAFGLINVVFLAWHFPVPYDLMMRDHQVHVAMHLMIMTTGVIMWWPVMSPLPELPRIAPPLQMVYLFVLGIPMMVTAAMITFSDAALYQWYVEAPRISSLSAIDDQRVGGLMMWVPGGLTLWLAITFVYFRWSRQERREEARTQLGPHRLVTVPPPFPEH